MYLSGGMFYESLRGLIVNELHVPSLHSLDAKVWNGGNPKPPEETEIPRWYEMNTHHL